MESIWSLDCRIPPREPLDGDRETDIAVIGAGMAGILIADALREAGRDVRTSAASSNGIRTKGHGTVPATARASTAAESSCPARRRTI